MYIFFSKIKIKGSMDKDPKKKRAKVNVSGPTKSIPVVCAIKAVPQINEANNRSMLPFKIFKVFYNLFNLIAFSLFAHHVSITIP